MAPGVDREQPGRVRAPHPDQRARAPLTSPGVTVGWAPDRGTSVEIEWEDDASTTPRLVEAAGADGRWFLVLRPEDSAAGSFIVNFTEEDPHDAPPDGIDRP